MVLPAYWWLLALMVIIQGAFFVRIFVLRIQRKGVQTLARPALVALGSSCLAGVAYAVVQRDPVFLLGQGCLIIFYYTMQRRKNDERK